MTYGYCRISTKKQNLQRQVENIKREYPDAILFEEAYTGKTMERPQWQKLLKKVKAGDTIIFDSVSRMSRNADEGVEQYERFVNEGVNLVFLNEQYINTETYTKARQDVVPMTNTTVDLILEGVNAYLKELARQQIRIAFEQSEKEVADLSKRTRDALAVRKQELLYNQVHDIPDDRKPTGRPTGSKGETKKAQRCKEIIRTHIDKGLPDTEIIILCNCSRNSYYKYKREVTGA